MSRPGSERFAVYDAGMLIGLEKPGPARSLHKSLIAERVTPVVPGPVYAQAWRPGRTAAAIGPFLAQCEIHTAYSFDDYRTVAQILAIATPPKGKRLDVVDALVVVTAELYRAEEILTSDPGDIAAYADAYGYEVLVTPV
ncbi:hypothetical protein ACFP3U_16865 [Kitasatospora misakiensis]|uniref:PIN domain-containing protein n=1 Tax=Kitasatospora misakiensis TaxID=67330 RepID=A0ABW0X4H9_9ACTN